MSNILDYIDQATKNISEDRAATKTLLMNLMKYLQVVAAKYLETLQRSNEQLVKLAALLQKKDSTSNEISDQDKQELFDLIKDKGEEQ